MRAFALINRAAARVSPRVAARLERAWPGRVAVTGALDEARVALREEIRRGVDLVVFGGGDGTVVMGLALLAEACRGLGRGEPAIGALALGAGNAFARSLGATDDAADDLARHARGEGRWRPQRLIEVRGLRAPFVGLGIDARLLEDQAAVGRAIDRVPGARRLVGGSARYAMSIALRSLPRLVFGGAAERALRAVVTNTGSPAIPLARGGERAGVTRAATGEVLWSGSYTLIAAATIESFGFGLKMFARAKAYPDRFQLRCGDPGILEIARSTPAAFRGEYWSDRVRDFACDRVVIHVEAVGGEESREVAFEAGGELVPGIRSGGDVELGLGAPVTVAGLD